MAIDYTTVDPRFDRVPLWTGETNDQGESTRVRALGAVARPLTAIRAVSGTSGLDYDHRIAARDLAMGAAFLALQNAPEVHYTQGIARWEGIAHELKAYKKQYPHHADCSAFFTWCTWNGLIHFGVRDVVNGLSWKAGYTGTLGTHGIKVKGDWMRGDAILYRGHVAIYIGGGLVVSHGSERGPFKLKWNYRRDYVQTRRFI